MNHRKKIVSILVVILWAQIFSQTTTYSPLQKIPLTGYVAPDIKMGLVNEEFGYFLGGEAGLVLLDQYTLGAGVYGLAPGTPADGLHKKHEVHLNYWGGFLEYTFVPYELVHGGFRVFLGPGILDLDGISAKSDPILVFEPAWFFEGNLNRYIQIGWGFSYRAVFGSDEDSYLNTWWSDSHFATNFRIKFGKFKIDYDP